MTKRIKTGGRQKGTPNKATAEIKSVAREYAPAAIRELARLVTSAESEQARIAAANSILDRAYGKPHQALVGDDDEPPIQTIVRWMQG